MMSGTNSAPAEPVLTVRKDGDDLWSPGATSLRWGKPIPAISKLPTELLNSILHLTLPHVEFTSWDEASTSRQYMQALYTTRSVSKQWQEVLDGTPSFWTVVLSTLPQHVNNATMIRSANLPLSVVYEYPGEWNTHGHPSSERFLRTIAHTRSRWSVLVLDISDDTHMPGYLAAPAPLLQTIVVRSSCQEDLDREPLELLGGQTDNIRYVAISAALIRWKMGLFTQLKVLNLTSLRYNLTASHVVDFLQASPDLEELCIESALELATSKISPPIITLSHLKFIDLECSDIKATEYILQHIRAPSCIKFTVCIGEEDEPDLSRFMHETLNPFQDILRRIHTKNGTSNMTVKSFEFEWRSNTEADGECGFSIQIGTYCPMGIHWVEQVLQEEHGLQVVFSYGAMLSEMRDIAPMRCVTSVSVSTQWSKRLRRLLQHLYQPLSPSACVPPLPNLRELLLPPTGWSAQDLLDTVQLRCSMFSKTTIDQPPLTINIRRENFILNSGLTTIPDLAILTKIKSTGGVGGVRFLAPQREDGMLAVIWNEEASAPTWGG